MTRKLAKSSYRKACSAIPCEIWTTPVISVPALGSHSYKCKSTPSEALNLDSFVQEVVLGKIASDVYNEAKKVAPLRHVGINKSKLLAQPEQPIQVPEEVIIEQ